MARFLTTYLRSGGRDSETVTAKLATANSLQVGGALPAEGHQAPLQHPLARPCWRKTGCCHGGIAKCMTSKS